MPSLVLQSTGEVIAHRVEFATTVWSRARGLVGRDIGPDAAFIIDRARSVHTFFMRFPIDVAFCAADWRIVALAPNLPPWRVTRRHARARTVIEMRAGSLARKVQVGDVLVITDP